MILTHDIYLGKFCCLQWSLARMDDIQVRRYQQQGWFFIDGIFPVVLSPIFINDDCHVLLSIGNALIPAIIEADDVPSQKFLLRPLCPAFRQGRKDHQRIDNGFVGWSWLGGIGRSQFQHMLPGDHMLWCFAEIEMIEYPTHEFDDPVPTTSLPSSDAPSIIMFTEQFEALQKCYR